jgi:hypothetical protein
LLVRLGEILGSLDRMHPPVRTLRIGDDSIQWTDDEAGKTKTNRSPPAIACCVA